MTGIEVGILGATGMVGQQFIALLADHPWFQRRVAWRQRALQGKALRRRRGLAPGRRRAGRLANRRSSRPPRRATRRNWFSRVSTPRSPARSKRPSPPPATSSSATRATTAWSRPCRCSSPRSTPIISRCSRRKRGHAAGRAHRHQSELLDGGPGDGARAAPPVRPEDDDGDDAAGDFGRRLPRRAVVGHPRKRHSVHRRREEEKIETETRKILGA